MFGSKFEEVVTLGTGTWWSNREYYNTQLDDDARVDLTFWSPVPDQTGARLRAGLSNFAGSGRSVLLDLVVGENQLAPMPDFFINSLSERIYDEPLPAPAFVTP